MTNRIVAVLALSILTAVWTAGPVAAQPARTKIVLDTDIGTDIDDAWALGYVLKSPSLELLGVTISDGDTAARARLACKLLFRLGRTDVPVAAGRATPAVPADRIDYQFAWAEDFRDYVPVATPAAEFLADIIRRNPNQVTLVAVGPLHNIGDLVRRHPDVIPLVKRVVLMSGSIGANAFSASAVAEWNVKLAIPEAQLVYAAAWPVTIVPLDSTTYVRLEDGDTAEGGDAAHRRARNAAAAVDRPALQPDDAARPARARRDAGARPLLRSLRADVAPRRRRRLRARRSRGGQSRRGLPRAEARRIHAAFHRAALSEVRLKRFRSIRSSRPSDLPVVSRSSLNGCAMRPPLLRNRQNS